MDSKPNACKNEAQVSGANTTNRNGQAEDTDDFTEDPTKKEHLTSVTSVYPESRESSRDEDDDSENVKAQDQNPEVPRNSKELENYMESGNGSSEDENKEEDCSHRTRSQHCKSDSINVLQNPRKNSTDGSEMGQHKTSQTSLKGQTENASKTDEDEGADRKTDEDEGADRKTDEDEGADRKTDEDEGADRKTDEDKGVAWKTVSLVLVVILAIVVAYWIGSTPSPPPGQSKKRIDIFYDEMEKLKYSFPRQRAEFWKRSKIHLSRRLQGEQHAEPVSVILTSGRRAEKTLNCVAVRMASALSSALNVSVVQIDGASKALLDSDKVKLDIDETLTGAFRRHGGVVVVHRFEELPPGSTLIFYRYCDHENAAFKEASLIFTVLLEEEEELEPHLNFGEVEEMVQDHIKNRFLSSDQPTTYDRMDVDKLSGLWSRVSHLILPVFAEGHIEQQGCKI